MPHLRHLLCQSNSPCVLEHDELLTLAVRGQAHAAEATVTGLLIYRPDGHFLHLMEGTEAALHDFRSRRTLAGLHPTDCTIVDSGPWAHRIFPDWHISASLAGKAPLPLHAAVLPLDQLQRQLSQLAPGRPGLVYMVQDFIAPWADWFRQEAGESNLQSRHS